MLLEDLPPTTHLPFNYVISYASDSYYETSLTHWDNNSYFTYAKLAEGVSLSEEAKASMGDYYTAQMLTMSYYEQNPDRVPILHYQPLTDIHLKSTHLNFSGTNGGDIKYVYTLLLIGIVILSYRLCKLHEFSYSACNYASKRSRCAKGNWCHSL